MLAPNVRCNVIMAILIDERPSVYLSGFAAIIDDFRDRVTFL